MVNMWMVRAGEGSFLIDEFIKNNIVAIGWDLGDLTDKSEEEITELYKKKYKNLRSVHQVLKFKNEIKVNDYVLSVNGKTKTYFIGKITSDYYRSKRITQADSSGENYFDVRDVEWLGEIQKDELKKSTQKAIGNNITVFNIKDNAKEEIIKVYSDNLKSIENAACIIRRYLFENNINVFSQNDNKVFEKFKKQFGPEVLEKLEGADIINKIFLHDGDKSTLCYNLEFSDEFNLGGIGGGFASKYSLYKSKDTQEWKAGGGKNQKVVSENEAIKIGSKIRDAIVNGAHHIEKAELNSIYDYITLENDLEDIFKDCIVNPTNNWIHKYYVLIFPDKFPEVHGNEMRNYTLRKFRIKPKKGYYVNDGLFYKLAQKAGVNLSCLFNEKIIGLFWDGENSWDPIEKGVLVDLDDCECPEPLGNDELRNKIYFGAPGTGKSYTLNEDKEELLKNYIYNYERVTFHPDYSYANFVGTYKPVPKQDGISFEYVPGPFMRILKKALEKHCEPFLLIIEEINRANVAATFGDIFQLLDRDENNESIYPIDTSEEAKAYINKDKIKIPSNLFLWCTMNSADQGVFHMDTAFKRRWDFKYFSINNNEELIKDTYVILNDIKLNWNTLRKAINDELLSYKINEDKCLGPFFAFNEYMNQEIPTETFKDIFKSKIIMYLFEDAARSKRNDLFSGAKTDNYVTYSQICEAFDEKGIEIFCDNIKSKFISDEE